MKKNKPLKVSIVMGSQSDYKTMQLAEKTLKKLEFLLKQKLYQHIELLKECMSLHPLLKKIILV
jgi:phosphoribosylcarboxyaminoimidazole (NCAIR) mutase